MVVLRFCAPSPGSFVLLTGFMFILCLSFKSCRELDSYLDLIWPYCKISGGNQLKAFIFFGCRYVLGSVDHL